MQSFFLTVGSLSGDLAKTIGRANADTTNPIVIKIEVSKHELFEPESLYRRAIKVGRGDKQ